MSLIFNRCRYSLLLMAALLLLFVAACRPTTEGEVVLGDEEPLTATESEDPEEAPVEDPSPNADSEPVANSGSGGLEVRAGSEETGPDGVNVGFTSEGYAFRGDPQAPVLIEEYSDYQCPYCSRFFEQTLPSLLENQIAAGEAVLVFYDFPLSSHPQAPAAAQAAHCAGEEGAAAYWAMHDALFSNLDEWSGQNNTTERFSGLAEELALDVDAFAQCLDGGQYVEHVQSAQRAGAARGVSGTPSFFINDQLLTGAQPLSVFNEAITRAQAGEPVAAEQPQQPGAIPTPASINEDFAAAMGDPEAPVTIVEFTDYQCPYCARHSQQTLPTLIEQFVDTGDVYYVVKDFPLDSIHPAARAAAAAARCAGDQEAYWEMHDALFAQQSEWAESDDPQSVFLDIATELGLDGDTLASCIESGQYEEAVEANFQEGAALGVNSTPFFFIDGYPVPGAQPFELFDFAIGLAKEGQLGEAYRPQPTPTPAPQRPVEIPTEDSFSIGEPDAPVVIVEYTDFQCPFCSRYFNETYPQIVENFVETGQARYVFKDFPLTSIHPQAMPAAQAARCAGEQDAFLEMHDALFAGQQEWSNNANAEDIFVGYAEELGLDGDSFAQCLQSGQFEEAILADLEEGAGFGVTGTPAFFINGMLLSGAQPYAAFEQAINQALSAE